LDKNRFKPVWLGFFGLARIFSDLAWFFPVFFGLGSFWFFWFQAYKTKTEPVGFFKILIGFFHGSVFSIIFFLFSPFNQFFFSPLVGR
jgi:hypothetical protein